MMSSKCSDCSSSGEQLSKEEDKNVSSTPTPPHVLILPFPLQGHIVPFLKLTELLCLAGLNVTLLNTEQIHSRLLQHSDVKACFARFPGFRMEAISDGRSLSDPPPTVYQLEEELGLLNSITKPVFKEALVSGRVVSGGMPPLTCIIGDALLNFAMEVANELEIPFFAFHVLNAATIWLVFSFPDLVDAGKFPFIGDEDDKIDCVKGLEGILRIKDIPMGEEDKGVGTLVSVLIQSCKADAVIFNTFDDLEGAVLSHMRLKYPNTYAVGPVHMHVRSRLSREPSERRQSVSSANIWQEDRSCMSWLDSQPSKSVVYVSFGSLTILKKDEFLELWHGLVHSGKRFLWVMRPNLVEGLDWDDQQPTKLVEEVGEGRTYVVRWAPQEEVLGHPATGSFVTQCGWNSVLEAIVAGVPMICWPYWGEQSLNSRFVSELYKVGVFMKDNDGLDRGTIATTVNEVMELRKGGLMESAAKMATLAKKAVGEGGSSYNDLDRLLDRIRLMAFKTPAKDYSY
ncbi:hypothetical protein Nepgr_012986 [Nepenthes gracilis]|uniref:2-hydroxyflavanone C-glucosyltransferase n=1 Tax=Nepenthes gracilis TaxID=150966 RepID=A0AAD3XNX6_NEPGR|nr:hypothetical protein Nepgr_012986 [Nepenthes gracilis]